MIFKGPMSRKGISEIIATILMLMITIGLAGTAFVYIQSALVGKTQQQIAFADASCSAASNTIYITIKNLDPKLNVTPGVLIARIDNIPVTATGVLSNPIPSQQNGVMIVNCTQVVGLPTQCTSGTIHQVKVIGPSNAVEGQAIC